MIDQLFTWVDHRFALSRSGRHLLNKIFPDQVEEVLLLAPGVREAAVVGIADDRLGEVPVAFIVGEATDVELEALCREHLTPYKIPVAFKRVEALPRSEIGKVLRQRLAVNSGP